MWIEQINLALVVITIDRRLENTSSGLQPQIILFCYTIDLILDLTLLLNLFYLRQSYFRTYSS